MTKIYAQEKLLEPFGFTSGICTFGNISTEFVKDAEKSKGKTLNKALMVLIHPLANHVDALVDEVRNT